MICEQLQNINQWYYLTNAIVASFNGAILLLPMDWLVSLRHIYREANSCVDLFAKKDAKGSSEHSIWKACPSKLFLLKSLFVFAGNFFLWPPLFFV